MWILVSKHVAEAYQVRQRVRISSSSSHHRHFAKIQGVYLAEVIGASISKIIKLGAVTELHTIGDLDPRDDIHITDIDHSTLSELLV